MTLTEEACRALVAPCELRQLDEGNRRATFVAATENGVETFHGREHLEMGGADLGRYQANPVVLDTHNRFEAGGVVGNAKARIDGRALIAEITFAETERALEVWELVRTGFIKALSIGFIPRRVEHVEEGATARLGNQNVQGPARIVREWELFEISVVPVPADRKAVRRRFFTDPADSYSDLGTVPKVADIDGETLMRAVCG